MWDTPTCTPRAPRLHQPATLCREGSSRAKQVPACGQGLHFQLHSYTVELQRFLPRCALPEGNNCMKADTMLLFILLSDCVMFLWAGLRYIHMAIFPVGESGLWHRSHGAQQWAGSVSPTHTWAGDHHCPTAAGKAATAWQGMGTLTCAVGGTAFYPSSLGFFPLTQDSLERGSGQTGREQSWVHPDMVQHLTIVSAFAIQLCQSGLLPQKGHQWNSCPPF